MSMDKIFGIAGTALNAQLTRMNSTASNLANAGTVSTTEQDAFRAKRPVFKALMSEEMTNKGAAYQGGVKVDRMADDTAPPRRVSDPNNPLADKDGYVYQSNVSEVTEMVEMMAAARSYQNNVEVINTARQLMMRTLDISKA
ncbi:flagellar basal body rod protein FlgC [Limnohabitans sp.]|jgi:flagellar basal-body rod protein FlgC|uniref:flagellar basal body rod protein FlgC n=1 Tax=Limnohabitans sp. TaxID=1907725 RepID=UPI00334062D4